jgi:hypothetical protein
MKKAQTKPQSVRQTNIDEILPEYDFSRGERNRYASRYVPGSLVVVLDPDVAATFGTSKEANEALRALAKVTKKRPSRPTSRQRGV